MVVEVNLAHEVLSHLPIPLCVISICLHSLGIYLLAGMKLRKNTQDIVILNLSAAEISMSACDLAQNICSRHLLTIEQLRYMSVVQCALFVVPYLLIMIVLTVNRFLEVYLNIHYHRVVTKRRMRIVLALCWTAGFLSLSALLPLHVICGNMATVIFKYILPTIEALFLLIALFSYGYIWTLFQKRNAIEKEIQKRRIKRTAFFPPFLIIVTFCIFVIAPDIANLFLIYIKEYKHKLILDVLLLFYDFGYICDAIIYIFLQKHLYLRMKRCLKRTRCHEENMSSSIAGRQNEAYSVDS